MALTYLFFGSEPFIMSDMLLQPAPLLFIGMSVAFGAVLLFCSVTDALRS